MTHRKTTLVLTALFALAMLVGCMGPKPVDLGNDAYQAGDAATAMQQYQAGIDAGDPEATLGMALLYAEGNGVPQDGTKAVAMMRQALEQGSYQAATSLGVCYFHGDFVQQSYETAAGYFAYAARNGDYLAIEYLMYMYENGLGVPRDPEMAKAIQYLAPLP